MKKYDIIEYCPKTQDTCVPVETEDGAWVEAEYAENLQAENERLQAEVEALKEELKTQREATEFTENAYYNTLDANKAKFKQLNDEIEALKKAQDWRTDWENLNGEDLLVISNGIPDVINHFEIRNVAGRPRTPDDLRAIGAKFKLIEP